MVDFFEDYRERERERESEKDGLCVWLADRPDFWSGIYRRSKFFLERIRVSLGGS